MIPLEKILSLEFAEWFEPLDSWKDRYDAVGVSYQDRTFMSDGWTSSMTEFAKKVPDNTEIVLKFRDMSLCTKEYVYIHHYGVALIPKKT